MKKICIWFLILLMLFPTFVLALTEKTNEDTDEVLIKNAKSGLLMEVSTGKILYEKNSEEKVAVASLTKMMAQLLILEKIEKGELSWDEKVTASSNASGMGGTQIWLTIGEVMSVRDLMKGITMASANDATVAMAEKIAGTEARFVEMMNEKAKELGLKNTSFKNCTGLDENGHYSTAKDLAVIAQELMKHEQIFEFSSVYEDYLRTDTENKFWLVNTNKLVRLYEGADGLKTGFTDAAKYCMAVTAKRNNMRLLAIVLGEDVSKVRNQETSELLDYGFNLYKIDLLQSKKDKVDSIPLKKASQDSVDVYTKEDVTILNKKSDVSLDYEREVTINNIELPLKNGDVIGKITFKYNNKVVKEEDLVVLEDVGKVNYFLYLFDSLAQVLSGDLL